MAENRKSKKVSSVVSIAALISYMQLKNLKVLQKMLIFKLLIS